MITGANISTAPWSSLRWSDPFITRELHTHKALDWPAIAASTKTTQPGQNDQTEVMYAQNTPMRTPLAVGRRRCANCPAFVNIGLVRQARVALGTLRKVVIIDVDASIAPFATLSNAEFEATTKQDSDPRACADTVIHVVRCASKRGESRTSSPSAPSCARSVGFQSMTTCARTRSARC